MELCGDCPACFGKGQALCTVAGQNTGVSQIWLVDDGWQGVESISSRWAMVGRALGLADLAGRWWLTSTELIRSGWFVVGSAVWQPRWFSVCEFYWWLTKLRMLMSPITTVDLSLSSFISVRFFLVHFEPAFNACTIKYIMSSWRIDSFIVVIRAWLWSQLCLMSVQSRRLAFDYCLHGISSPIISLLTYVYH